jgi:hypothetical protein
MTLAERTPRKCDCRMIRCRRTHRLMTRLAGLVPVMELAERRGLPGLVREPARAGAPAAGVPDRFGVLLRRGAGRDPPADVSGRRRAGHTDDIRASQASGPVRGTVPHAHLVPKTRQPQGSRRAHESHPANSDDSHGVPPLRTASRIQRRPARLPRVPAVPRQTLARTSRAGKPPRAGTPAAKPGRRQPPACRTSSPPVP